jgi:phage terminase large subunit
MDDRSYIAESERRVEHARKVTSSHRALMIEREICKNDPLHWISHYVYGHDPREPNAYVPFMPFEKQKSFVQWLEEREKTRSTGLAEKCRDAGVTSLGCAYAVHGFLFREGFRMGFGSQKEEYVDRLGDSKSIFEKIRFIIRNLPEWQLPRGWDPRVHLNFRRIVNPANGATLVGEAGDDLGRGDRTSLYWLDEAATVERAGDVEAALSQTSNVRIYVSTPRGPGNWFYRKRFGGNISVFSFMWTDDPRKDAAWLDKQKAELEPHVVAQEILLDYSASIEGIFIPAAWVRAAVDLELPASGPVVAGLDIGEEGADISAFIPRQGPVVREIVTWGGVTTHTTAHSTRWDTPTFSMWSDS